MGRTGISLTGLAVLAHALPAMPQPVPGASGVAVSLPAISLGLAGVLVSMATDRPDAALEGAAGRPLWPARCAWAACVLVCSVVAMGVAVGVDIVDLLLVATPSWVVWRDVALAVGLGLIASCVLPVVVSWVPVALLDGLTLLYGQTPGGSPHWWAVLLQAPAASGVVLGLGIFAVGLCCYGCFDSRPTPLLTLH